MTDYGNANWPINEITDTPSCIVVNEDTRTVVSEFDTPFEAALWIADSHDHQEDLGLDPANYQIYPVKVSPGGKDVR